MDEMTGPSTAVAGDPAPVDTQRPCTRCDGRQHLVASGHGMGKYRCDTCEMVVGFDLSTSSAEFLLDRGLPSRYTRDVFGTELTAGERRLVGSRSDEAMDPVQA